jgi:hypothetical protein
MTFEHDDERTLSLRIYGAILRFEEGRLRAPSTQESTGASSEMHAASVRDARALAMQIWNAASTLVVPSVIKEVLTVQPEPGGFSSLVPEDLKKSVLEELEIGSAYAATDDLEGQADRCLDLCELALRSQPNEAVSRYLRRLGRCYVAGFFPECVILCRAAIENGIKHAFDRKHVPLPANDSGASAMRTRLNAAAMFGWMSSRAKQYAETVWYRGSKAVHEDPSATADALETIAMTMAVLNELYS